MFQPEVKLEFVRRYCPPHAGWHVFVDVDASEEGRTGGDRMTEEAQQRQRSMQKSAARTRKAFVSLGVQVGHSREKWFRDHDLPPFPGDRDILAYHPATKTCLVAEAEGHSSGQPEQKLYKAIGQVVLAASADQLPGWNRIFVLVVFGDSIAKHLSNARALTKLNISAVAIDPDPSRDFWLFGTAPIPRLPFSPPPAKSTAAGAFELFQELDCRHELSHPSKWVGNDDSMRNYHRRLPQTISRLDLVLSWKTAASAEPRLIGYFRFNLPKLLEGGYIVLQRNGCYRFRLYHGKDDCIYVQPPIPGSPGLLIGSLGMANV
jgi:hypothetical protein